MRRRRALALLASTVPFAGCSGASPETDEPTATDNSSETTETSTRSSTRTTSLSVGDTYETVSGETITLADVELRRTMFDKVHPDVWKPFVPESSQFVFLTLAVDDQRALAPDPASFRLSIDGATYSGAESVAGKEISTNLSVANDGVHVAPAVARDDDHPRATVGFEVPLDVTPDRVAVEWVGDDEATRWTWDDSLVELLGAPPEFGVARIDAPETFACGEPFDASVTLANDGGRREPCNATVRIVEPVREQHPAWLAPPISAGDRAIEELELTFPPRLQSDACTDDVDEATFRLDWGTGTRDFSVERRR